MIMCVMRSRFVVTLFMGVWWSSAVDAQQPPKRYVCNMETVAGERMRLEFVHEVYSARAFVVGNAGLAPVTPFVGSNAVTFVEWLPSGATQTTTISQGGDAVHSRHSIIMDRVVPSQLKGSCS